ncbi:pyridoxamine 5'-phosphate oxidase family protein [Novosphingobium sp. JCM 18896]|uniref:pyridoxamine 5'-phosphate oxidase family protein n=1 Tax=Novosphingobium sp. JCM 18896 TaxID=2989731 RepID=UPI00222160F1|nr:pyridoxamine 5'-phosphate oxidase family protein [Novosphingobium sp. JCM 18896]MCW1429775.1 pyridoxamine 5'-phosphate oxidase family protein [Novosphingobium sp. JCM 18896]
MKKELREEFWHAFEKSPFIMLRLEGNGGHAEPMTAQLDKEAIHTIWFFTSKDNRIAAGGRAMAQFSAKGHDVFACLAGNLVEETDQARIDKHWSKEVEAWFPQGRHDPNLKMLRFEIDDAEVWTVELGLFGTFKMLTGQEVKSSEMGQHATGLV